MSNALNYLCVGQDRVEKMDIKREQEKQTERRIASKQKMNKHSTLLVKRKWVSCTLVCNDNISL